VYSDVSELNFADYWMNRVYARPLWLKAIAIVCQPLEMESDAGAVLRLSMDMLHLPSTQPKSYYSVEIGDVLV
jgi:hypothetical protein